MTLQREHRDGPFVIQCDLCMETEELEGTAFHEALEDARERGYRARKAGGEWHHLCKDCDT